MLKVLECLKDRLTSFHLPYASSGKARKGRTAFAKAHPVLKWFSVALVFSISHMTVVEAALIP
ncbi:MAG: hypothetical protein J0G29_07820, partial [Alphaproteobacteria bacterium]|nr:hypothetical protein [Alphaproteobacteria bacterium]